MSAFVITVDFTVKPGAMAAFRKLIDRNARDSCADEPGCRRFDVLVPKAGRTAYSSMKFTMIAPPSTPISRRRISSSSTAKAPSS